MKVFDAGTKDEHWKSKKNTKNYMKIVFFGICNDLQKIFLSENILPHLQETILLLLQETIFKEEVQHFGNNGPKCGFMLTELTSLYDFCAF